MVGWSFEYMVKSIKRCIHMIVGQPHFSQDEFLTAVIEIEGVIED